MATITRIRDHQRLTTANQARTPTLLVASLLVALAVALGSPLVGAGLAAVFIAGMALARWEERPLRSEEFGVIAGLHVLAVVLLSF